MEKIKVVFINNHFQYSDGTVRALIGMVNHMDTDKYDITIKPLYRCDRRLESELKSGIKLEKCFGFYFRGFSKIAKLIPVSWLYKKFIGNKYDVEIAYQSDLPTILVGNSMNENAVHIAWMHGYELWPKEYKRMDKVICVSKSCADRAKNEMGDDINVTYRYNLVDDSVIKQKATEKADISTNASPIFATVGRLSPEKGYTRLLNICGELRDEGYNFHLLLIGGGPEEERLRQLVKEKNLEKYVTMPGATPNPHKYTSQADVFVCSSFSEGYSTACTEAAILGVPIITTCVSGGAEIIDECECGLLTSLDDSDLKSAMCRAIECPDMVESWKATMKRTSVGFEMASRAKQMEQLFDEIEQIYFAKRGYGDEKNWGGRA